MPARSGRRAATADFRVAVVGGRMAICARLVAVFIGATLTAGAMSEPAHAAANVGTTQSSTQYLSPDPHPSQRFGNVFSIARSVKAADFDELVARNSGTATYETTAADRSKLVFAARARYDGKPVDEATDELTRDGRTDCWGGKCRAYTDASGLLYNQRLWGRPPARLRRGDHWRVTIDRPWEMGPAADQIVSVVRLDPAARAATLRREGKGDGPFADDPRQIHITRGGKSYLVTLVPGRAHWVGYTTFVAGFVHSDELVVDRLITLRSAELGDIPAVERIYMLLNATPADADAKRPIPSRATRRTQGALVG